MATIYCSLPKELIIGKSGQRREQEYSVGVSPNSPTHKVIWEDSGDGLIARNVNGDVEKMLLKRSGFAKVDSESKPTKQVKTEAPVETVTTAPDPVTTRGRKRAEK